VTIGAPSAVTGTDQADRGACRSGSRERVQDRASGTRDRASATASRRPIGTAPRIGSTPRRNIAARISGPARSCHRAVIGLRKGQIKRSVKFHHHDSSKGFQMPTAPCSSRLKRYPLPCGAREGRLPRPARLDRGTRDRAPSTQHQRATPSQPTTGPSPPGNEQDGRADRGKADPAGLACVGLEDALATPIDHYLQAARERALRVGTRLACAPRLLRGHAYCSISHARPDMPRRRAHPTLGPAH